MAKNIFGSLLAWLFILLNAYGIYLVINSILPKINPSIPGIALLLVILLLALLSSILGAAFYYRAHTNSKIAVSIIAAGIFALVINMAALALIIYSLINSLS
jgi:hypothetical protein